MVGPYKKRNDKAGNYRTAPILKKTQLVHKPTNQDETDNIMPLDGDVKRECHADLIADVSEGMSRHTDILHLSNFA